MTVLIFSLFLFVPLCNSLVEHIISYLWNRKTYRLLYEAKGQPNQQEVCFYIVIQLLKSALWIISAFHHLIIFCTSLLLVWWKSVNFYYLPYIIRANWKISFSKKMFIPACSHQLVCSITCNLGYHTCMVCSLFSCFYVSL